MKKKERIGSSRFELEPDPNLTPIRIKRRHLSTSYYPNGVDSDLASKTQIFEPLNFELWTLNFEVQLENGKGLNSEVQLKSKQKL